MQHRYFIALLAGLSATALTSVCEASLARALGTRYGGKLSGTSSLSTQQLTGDPASILRGSMSTEYDPDVVRLIELFPGPSFDATALIGFRLLTDAPTVERFVSDSVFFAGLPFPFEETGYVQVSFVRKDGNLDQSFIPPRDGFTLLAVNGETGGDDTHALFFESIVPDPIATIATYRLYREDGTLHDVLPDYLVNLDNQTTTEIGDAIVSTPEPSLASIGLVVLAGGALARRGRRPSRA